MNKINSCPCCGNNKFQKNKVLWDDLIKQWSLSKKEVNYINRQQGLVCKKCSSSLRSMTLAKTIMNSYGYEGIFFNFIKKFKNIKILEINEAGNLSIFLDKFSNRVFAEYPKVDMTNLPYDNNSFDLVLHSDTLEHINKTQKALSECRRVLRNGGYLCYTVPVVVGRLTKKRNNDVKSYHGYPGDKKDDFIVYTEYGCDAWTDVIKAGFNQCTLCSIDFPASIGISAKKTS